MKREAKYTQSHKKILDFVFTDALVSLSSRIVTGCRWERILKSTGTYSKYLSFKWSVFVVVLVFVILVELRGVGGHVTLHYLVSSGNKYK